MQGSHLLQFPFSKRNVTLDTEILMKYKDHLMHFQNGDDVSIAVKSNTIKKDIRK
jgi:hypothetical protein